MNFLEQILTNKKTIVAMVGVTATAVIVTIAGIVGLWLFKSGKLQQGNRTEVFEALEAGMKKGEKEDNRIDGINYNDGKLDKTNDNNSMENAEVANKTENVKDTNDEKDDEEGKAKSDKMGESSGDEGEGKIAIHITGEVKKTGILYLKEGARIADAIKAAGGATKNANLDQVNLAYVLEDGQKIYIPNKKEKIGVDEYIIRDNGKNVLVESGKNSGGSSSSNSSANTTKGLKTKVNINTAKQEELETLPGIGPALAERIIEYRKANGKFKSIEDIQNVKGIGDSKYRNIKESICI